MTVSLNNFITSIISFTSLNNFWTSGISPTKSFWLQRISVYFPLFYLLFLYLFPFILFWIYYPYFDFARFGFLSFSFWFSSLFLCYAVSIVHMAMYMGLIHTLIAYNTVSVDLPSNNIGGESLCTVLYRVIKVDYSKE